MAVERSKESGLDREFDKGEISRFSQKERYARSENGYFIFVPTRETVEDLYRPFEDMAESNKRVMPYVFHQNFKESLGKTFDETAGPYEIAVHMGHLFVLPGSGNRTYSDQQRMMRQFSKAEEDPGIEAFIGNVAEYIEAAFSIPEEVVVTGSPFLNLGLFSALRTSSTATNGMGVILKNGYGRGPIFGVRPRLQKDIGTVAGVLLRPKQPTA